MITIYTPEEVEKIAAAGRLTADTLSMLEKEVKPGISTLELDEMAENLSETEAASRAAKAMKDIRQHFAPLLTILLSMEYHLREKF